MKAKPSSERFDPHESASNYERLFGPAVETVPEYDDLSPMSEVQRSRSAALDGEAGMMLERQLLLAERGPHWLPRRWGKKLAVATAVAVTIAAVAVLYARRESAWEKELATQRDNIANLELALDAMTLEREAAETRLADKARESQRLSALADRTLEELSGALEETRHLRTSLAAETAARKAIERQRLQVAVRTLSDALEATWVPRLVRTTLGLLRRPRTETQLASPPPSTVETR